MAFDQREELKLRSSSVDLLLELVQFPVLGSDRTREIYSAHVPNQLETLHWGKGMRERGRAQCAICISSGKGGGLLSEGGEFAIRRAFQEGFSNLLRCHETVLVHLSHPSD